MKQCSYKNLLKISILVNNVKEVKKQGIILSEVVLAMQLIDHTGVDKKDKQIVLTAVDYTKKVEMYEQMKNA